MVSEKLEISRRFRHIGSTYTDPLAVTTRRFRVKPIPHRHHAADRIPDPTTAGDFCRRFSPDVVEALQDVFDQTRVKVWKEQPPDFFDEAVLDVDGTLVPTGACCKQGVDIAYDGTWGYHPLIVSLANTGEVISLVNRPGNRPSHEGAAEQLDLAILLCRGAGFRRIYLRGDTDFTQTKQLDAWDAEG